MMYVANVIRITFKNKNEQYSRLYELKIHLRFHIIVIIKKVT